MSALWNRVLGLLLAAVTATTTGVSTASAAEPETYTQSNFGNLGFNSSADMGSFRYVRYKNIVDGVAAQSSGAVVFNGTLYEFARGPDGTVKYWFANGGPWSSVQTIGGNIASDPVATVFNGHLYVFAVGTDGTINYWFGNGGPWSSAQTIGGSVSNAIGTAVFNGHLYVFAIGTDGTIKYWFDALLKADATFVIRRGLADPTCFSLETRNFPGKYLRHANFRVRLDSNDSSDLFRHDATFCAQPGLVAGSLRLASVNELGTNIRHLAAEVWVATSGGAHSYDTPTFYAEDTSWAVTPAWNP